MADTEATTKSSSNYWNAPKVQLTGPSTYSVGLINTLSYLRVAIGASFLFAPTFAGKIFQLTIAPNSLQSTAVRLFAGRDIVLGEHLWFVRPKAGDTTTMRPRTTEERSEMRRVLWSGVAADAFDIAVLAYAVSGGGITRTAAACVGGGATLFLGMGLLALREV